MPASQPQPAGAASQGFAATSPAVAEVARLYKQHQDTAALLEEARKHLPVLYRDDGPPLGFDFDDIPGAASFASRTAQHVPYSDPPNLG